MTGKIPTESILRATRPLQNPSELNRNISPKTEAAIIKAMQIIPADRFQTVDEMMAALDFPAEEEYLQMSCKIQTGRRRMMRQRSYIRMSNRLRMRRTKIVRL